MELVIGKTYVLSGWVFSSAALVPNGNKFICWGHDGDGEDPQYEFRGVEDGTQQWCYLSIALDDDDDVTIVEYTG